LVLALSFFAALAISIPFGRKISRPILDLTEMAKIASEQKNYSVRAKEGDPDEVGSLVTAFNQMVAQIQQDAVALRGLNEELEQKVVLRTAELSATNKELEAFCYSVSHDLRSPLRAIDGFSRELLQSIGQLNEQGQSDLKRIRAATLRMSQLIDDLLKLSQVTRGDMKREPVDLSGMVERILDDLKATQPDRKIELRVTPGLTAQADPRLLRAALENLVGNAWKFTQKRDDPVIEFAQTEQDGKRPFFIRDNGAGFNMAYSNKLFGVFQRLHDVHDFPGTGVGLATVQRIIHRHGGEIWAQSAEGQGATFYFTVG
jgi:light-regulated signal transduction histidine kinase (bacteriophytochrome)